MTLPQDALARWRDTPEIEIETSRALAVHQNRDVGDLHWSITEPSSCRRVPGQRILYG